MKLDGVTFFDVAYFYCRIVIFLVFTAVIIMFGSVFWWDEFKNFGRVAIVFHDERSYGIGYDFSLSFSKDAMFSYAIFIIICFLTCLWQQGAKNPLSCLAFATRPAFMAISVAISQACRDTRRSTFSKMVSWILACTSLSRQNLILWLWHYSHLPTPALIRIL